MLQLTSYDTWIMKWQGQLKIIANSFNSKQQPKETCGKACTFVCQINSVDKADSNMFFKGVCSVFWLSFTSETKWWKSSKFWMNSNSFCSAEQEKFDTFQRENIWLYENAQMYAILVFKKSFILKKIWFHQKRS